MAASSSESRNLLSQVLTLMRGDIGAISKEADGRNGRLDPETAAVLVKYSGALLAISKDADASSDEEKKQLAKLTDAELLEKAEAALASLRSKKVEG